VSRTIITINTLGQGDIDQEILTRHLEGPALGPMINTWSDEAREAAAQARRSKRAAQGEEIFKKARDETGGIPERLLDDKAREKLRKSSRIARKSYLKLKAGQSKADLLKKHGYM
jgi:hypothetical protein